MKYTLPNKKVIKIDDKLIDNYMKSLDLTKDEAIQTYLEDEGYLDNDEQIALDESAKKVKIQHGAYEEKSRKKSDKPRKITTTDEKKELFSKLLTFLSDNYGENVEIVKENKLILINFPNNRPIKIDIIQQRPPKK